jgi:hypothetical protein
VLGRRAMSIAAPGFDRTTNIDEPRIEQAREVSR